MATAHALILAGAPVSAMKRDGATPLDRAATDECRDLLNHHASNLAAATSDPAALASAVQAHCVDLTKELQTAVPATVPSLRAYHRDPLFLWAPPDAYAAVVAWNRKAFTVQVAVVSQLFQEISDDIAGDIFEFLEPSMSRTEWMHVATNCSSPEARTWVRSMMAAAVAVSDVACFK